MPHTRLKNCGCSINACCGECLREEQQRSHSTIRWSATAVVVLFALVVVALVAF
jgi:hypothetical protein